MAPRGRMTEFRPGTLPEVWDAMCKAAVVFEDSPRYEVAPMVELFWVYQRMIAEQDAAKQLELAASFQEKAAQLEPKADAPERIYLWPEGNIPTLTTAEDVGEDQYSHPLDFKPFMYAITVPEDVTPKGAVLCCAGGYHGASVLHESYQDCMDFAALGYQAFVICNRVNGGPWKGIEAGVDVARAMQIIRANADKYRIDPNHIAFAGFSNGGVTGDHNIRHFTNHTVAEQFPGYTPDEIDAQKATPDIFLCIYSLAAYDESFDYSDIEFPPTFFAVGRDDTVIDGTLRSFDNLMKKGTPVELHTFAATPHGRAGGKIVDGKVNYPNFDLWIPLADSFMDDAYSKK